MDGQRPPECQNDSLNCSCALIYVFHTETSFSGMSYPLLFLFCRQLQSACCNPEIHMSFQSVEARRARSAVDQY